MSSTLRRFSWRWVTIFTGLYAENNQKFVYKAPIEKHPRNSLSCSNRHQSEKFFYLNAFAFSVKTKTFCSIISICQPGYESKSRPREIQIASDELIHIILAFSFCYITTLRNHLILFTVYFLARLMLFCLVRESQTRRNGLQSYLYLFSRNEVIAFWRIVNLVSDKILKFRPSVRLIEYLFRNARHDIWQSRTRNQVHRSSNRSAICCCLPALIDEHVNFDFLVCYLFKNFHWSQLHFITVWEQPMRTSQRNLCFSILIINIGIVRIVFVMSSTLYVAKYYATWFGLNSFNLLFCVAVMLWCQGIDIRYNSVLEGIVRTWEMA